ncbi:hypothetical protein ALMP_59660 [Streptomyces sp. A012304]|nr:hypothetical protein ALMP_59660 [Streptomyces sp. A012304]
MGTDVLLWAQCYRGGLMRWENLTVKSRHDRAADPALFGADAVTTRAHFTP